MKKFAKIQVGDTAELTHTITQEDVNRFVDLTGDNNKLHVDSVYAESTSFKKPVAHGMLGASFISTIIGTQLPGDGALWFAQNLEFLLPVRIHDQITVRAEVIKKNEATFTIELKTDIFNQHRQKVTAGTAKVKIVEQEEPEKLDAAITERPQVVLVVGASGGIGSAVCELLGRQGFQVAVHYHGNEKRATQLKNTLQDLKVDSSVFRADVTQVDQVKNLVQQVLRRFGHIDVLVNCSTIKVPGMKWSEVNWADMQNHFDINIRGNFNLCQSVIPLMETQKKGKIIHLVTQYIDGTPPALFLPYVTAKAALQGFSKALAVELAPKGITVNLVSPGMTETELIADVPEKSRLLQAARSPIRRLATPQDVAAAVAYLASPGADYVTGETIRVNGGQAML